MSPTIQNTAPPNAWFQASPEVAPRLSFAKSTLCGSVLSDA